MAETYVSIDIETDGPAPGLNSMLALGAAAFTKDGRQLATWTANLDLLPDAVANPDTAKWWLSQPEAWAICRVDLWNPKTAMPAFSSWVERLPGKKTAVAWPAAFDFAFVNWYCHKFAGRNPLGFACLDLRSFAMGLTYSRGYYDLREQQIKELRGTVDRTGLRMTQLNRVVCYAPCWR